MLLMVDAPRWLTSHGTVIELAHRIFVGTASSAIVTDISWLWIIGWVYVLGKRIRDELMGPLGEDKANLYHSSQFYLDE